MIIKRPPPKEMLRTNLDMIDNNMNNFNDYALRFIDKKALRRLISIWRWFISHGYFNEKHPQPKGICSKPPLAWLDSQLEGLTVPLYRDIAECTMPKIRSSVMTEQAARRIMNRMNMIYGYVTQEAAEADRQAHRDAQEKKRKDRLRAQKAQVDRKAERKAEHQTFIEKEGPKLAKQRLKKKEEDRKALRAFRKSEKDRVSELARSALHKMKEEQRERRK